MKKDARVELWQIKMSLMSLIIELNDGQDHLDALTARTIARSLAEILQEVVSMPKRMSVDEIDEFVHEALTGTGDMQQALANKWFEELEPLRMRTEERADYLGHNLGEFTCLSVDGRLWGAVCIQCTQWIYVSPEGATGALLNNCQGWLFG